MQIKEIQTQRAVLREVECPLCPAECRDFSRTLRLLGFAVCFVFIVQLNYAQTEALPFQNGEELYYDIHYKYGMVMLKGGTGRYRITETVYNGQQACRSNLHFKTSSFFDKIFKIRDTINSYIHVPELVPLFNSRSVNEGNTHFTEDLWMKKHTTTYSEVYVQRKKNNVLRFDTTLSVKNLGFDILNVFIFIRTLDYSKIKQGDSFLLSVFLGERKANIIIRYAGQTVIEKSSKLKYKALKLNVDITDEVFSGSKNAMEVWISDDENRVPLKLKAKLKIGAAEADLSSYRNLKNPFSSQINVSDRK